MYHLRGSFRDPCLRGSRCRSSNVLRGPFLRFAALTGLLLLAACGSDVEGAEEDATQNATQDATEDATEDAAGTDTPEIEAASGESPVLVPAGTQVAFVVQEELSTASHREGDRFRLTVSQDVRSEEGFLRISRGTEAEGVVTTASRSQDSDRPAILSVQVASLHLDGRWVSLPATVTAVDIQADSGDSGTRTAAKIATGTAAGAMVGRILGNDRRSTVTGAAVGAAAGTAAAVTTRSGHATISEGSLLIAELDTPLALDW